jgi:hypothetical protein
MKGADDHDKVDSPEGGNYARRAKTRRRDWHLPRRYVAQPSRLISVPAHGRGIGRNCVHVVVTHRVKGVVIIGSRDNDDHPGIVVAAMTSLMTKTT